MLPFLVLVIIGDSFFSLVFGANWTEAGIYAQILSFKIFISFIINPVLSLPTILEKQEINLILCIVTTLTSIIAIVVGGLLNNIYVAISLLSLMHGLVMFCFGLYMIRHLGIPLLKIFDVLLKCFISCLPVISIIVLAKLVFGVSPLFLIIISGIGCVVYYGILLKENKFLQSTIMGFFRKA